MSGDPRTDRVLSDCRLSWTRRDRRLRSRSLLNNKLRLIIVLDSLSDDSHSFFKMNRAQVLERDSAHRAAEMAQSGLHPPLALNCRIGGQQGIAVPHLQQAPQHFDAVERGAGRRKEQQLSSDLFHELQDSFIVVSGVIVKNDGGSAEIMGSSYRGEELIDDLAIGAIGEPAEELARTHGTKNRSVDALLFAKAHLDPRTTLP